MKIKDGFLLRKFGDDYIVVAVGEEADAFNRLITLNGVGAFIYQQLSEDITFEEICKRVLDKYDIDIDTAQADVKAFLADVRKAGLLNE